MLHSSSSSILPWAATTPPRPPTPCFPRLTWSTMSGCTRCRRRPRPTLSGPQLRPRMSWPIRRQLRRSACRGRPRRAPLGRRFPDTRCSAQAIRRSPRTSPAGAWAPRPRIWTTRSSPGATYYYRVSAASANGTSDPSVAVQSAALASSSGSKFADISTRGFVGTGANSLIGGFVIAGPSPKTVLIRASGPGHRGKPLQCPGHAPRSAAAAVQRKHRPCDQRGMAGKSRDRQRSRRSRRVRMV